MISVCMATYNGERYIREQIESILNNITDQDELIISDDGSLDNTCKIIKEYEDRGNIILIEGPKKGYCRNFENALLRAKGDYIFLSDQDDIWHKNKVKEVMRCFEEKSCMLVFHDAVVVDSEKNKLADSYFSLRKCRRGFWINILRNSYLGCAMAFDRRLLEYVLPFPRWVSMHDWWIGLISEIKNSSYFYSGVLMSYRRHEKNFTTMKHYPWPIMIRNRVNMLVSIVIWRLQ